MQWHAFQRVVQILQRRGNRVFVLLGPFNEHMLKPASRKRYQEINKEIAGWLQPKQIAYLESQPRCACSYSSRHVERERAHRARDSK